MEPLFSSAPISHPLLKVAVVQPSAVHSLRVSLLLGSRDLFEDTNALGGCPSVHLPAYPPPTEGRQKRRQRGTHPLSRNLASRREDWICTHVTVSQGSK